MTVSKTALAAHLSSALTGINAEEMGYPYRDRVIRFIGMQVTAGLSTAETGSDPLRWSGETAEQILDRNLSPVGTDYLRGIGWPHTPTTAETIAGWFADAGAVTG